MAIRELPAMPPKKSNLSNMRISVIPVIEKIWYNADFLRSKANEENFESIASHCPCYNFCGSPASVEAARSYPNLVRSKTEAQWKDFIKRLKATKVGVKRGKK